MAPRTNAQTMLKTDNNNDYDYDQALGEKYSGQRQYIIPRSEV